MARARGLGTGNSTSCNERINRRLTMALPTRVARGTTHDPYESAQREFDSMLNRFFGNREGDGNGGGYLAPFAVDVREDRDHLYVEAELPGFSKDDVDITLENQNLTITAERRSDSEREQEAG